jgi:hypothetical protein
MGVDYRRAELSKGPDELDQGLHISKRVYFTDKRGNDSYFNPRKHFGFVQQQPVRTCHENSPEQATIEPRHNL